MNFWKNLFGKKSGKAAERSRVPADPLREHQRDSGKPDADARAEESQPPKPLSKGEIAANVKALPYSSTSRGGLDALTGQPASEVLAVIKEALGSTDYLERGRVCSALSYVGLEFGWPETVALLEPSLSDKESYVVSETISSLSSLARNESLKPLVVACTSRNITRLVEVFAGTTDLNVLSPVQSLLELAGPVCVEHLLPLLPKMTNKWQLEYATEILEKFKASPLQSKAAILESLRSNDVAQRKKACYESVNVADREVVDALIRVLEQFPEPQLNQREDVYQSTRKGTAFALGKIGDAEALSVLRAALANDVYWEVLSNGTVVRRPNVRNKLEIDMPAFGTSVREGLEEADTEFARSVLAQR